MFGRGKAFEARIAEALKLCEVRIAETLVEVEYDVYGEPSSCILPIMTGMLSFGAEGPSGREGLVKNSPSTTGYLRKF
jgi:hypothetical protein